jgi:hypothetical protein
MSKQKFRLLLDFSAGKTVATIWERGRGGDVMLH